MYLEQLSRVVDPKICIRGTGPSRSLLLSFPSPFPLSLLPSPLEVGSQIRGLGECCKLPQRVRRETRQKRIVTL